MFPSAMRRHDGFTLLEICLVIVIGLMLLTLAVPGFESLFAEQKLKKTFEDFDEFVHLAQKRSVTERRTFVMVWHEGGITLEPEEPTDADKEAETVQFAIEDGSELTIERPAALEKEPPMEWPFWRSGTCEPVVVSYKGEAGTWTAQYDPLTVRGTFLEKSQTAAR